MNLEPNNKSLSFADFLEAAIRDKEREKCSVLLRTVFKNQELRALRRRRKIREHFGVSRIFLFCTFADFPSLL